MCLCMYMSVSLQPNEAMKKKPLLYIKNIFKNNLILNPNLLIFFLLNNLISNILQMSVFPLQKWHLLYIIIFIFQPFFLSIQCFCINHIKHGEMSEKPLFSVEFKGFLLYKI